MDRENLFFGVFITAVASLFVGLAVLLVVGLVEQIRIDHLPCAERAQRVSVRELPAGCVKELGMENQLLRVPQ